MKKVIILAYSGGLDTISIVPWLQDNYQADVITFCADLGNAPDEKFLRDWSKRLGAKEFIFEDLKEIFSRDFVFKTLRAQATYQDDYLLGTAIARPLIAERVAHVAKKFNAFAVAHGATGKGNDQLRFEQSWSYLIPDKEIIAPWKIWDFTGRQDLVNYLQSKDIPFNPEDKTYSIDINLLHRSCEGGVLEDPEKEYNPEEIYNIVTPPSKLVPEKTDATIEFVNGIPVGINGQKLAANEIISQLNSMGGAQGIGVLDLVEERQIGIKSRGIYETPGGSILYFALKQLKHLCWDRNLLNTARHLGERYGELVYDGLWHSNTCRSIDAFFDHACTTLTGSITLQLYAGSMIVKKRISPYSLYSEEGVTFEADKLGIHKAAAGYSQILNYKQILQGKRDNGNTRN